MKVCAELVGASSPFVEGLVAALGEHDALWYSRHPGAPSPQQAGVRWRPDAPASEFVVLDAATLLAAGIGSCGSIAAAQYGWLRAGGAPAWLLSSRRGAVWHVVVKTPQGIWDPMRLAALPGRAAISGAHRRHARGNWGTTDIGSAG